MTSFLTSLYLLNFKQTNISHSIYSDCIKTSNKHSCTQGLYCNPKNEFVQSRCSECNHHWGWNKNLKYVEKLMNSYKCIFLSSEIDQSLLMFFSNGAIASIKLNSENNTLKKVEIDNKLCGKFIASRVVDAIFCQNYIFVTYAEPKLAIIHINQETPSLSAKILGKKKGKLLGFEPKVNHIDLIGPSSKNLERKLAVNSTKDLLLVWWRFSDDVWPWTPVACAADRANMLIYSLKGCIEVLCTVKVNGELINCTYSNQYSNHIFTIEETKWEKGLNTSVSVYEILGNQCLHVCISKLPLNGKVLSFHWSLTDKLIIADSNNFLLIYDSKQKSSIVKNLLFVPKHIIWHPQDFVALVTGTSGQVQCFDAALTCITFKLFYAPSSDHSILELSSHLAQNFSIQKLIWLKSDLSNSLLLWLDSHLCSFILIKFTFGSMTRNSLTALELISQYLKSNSVDEALLLLRSLRWWHASELHFQCLSKIANFLLRKPFNHQVEAALELTLGTFFNNIDKMPKRILKLYQHKVNHLARRFFHHLLRHYQFRKAFLLAVDLESQDLFLDLSHVAKEKGENVLALVALHKANEVDQCQKSNCSSSTASNSYTTTSTASNAGDENWEESHDSFLQSNDISLSESSGNSWLPIPENSEWTGEWLNTSEKDIHIQHSFLEKSSLQDLSLSSINGCNNLPDHQSLCSNTNYDSNSVGENKLQVTLSSQTICPPSFCPKTSQLSLHHHSFKHHKPSNLSAFYKSKCPPNESTYHCRENSDLRTNQSEKLRFINTSNPRPLPDSPSAKSKSIKVSRFVSMHNLEKQPAIDRAEYIGRESVTAGNFVQIEHEEVDDPKIKLVHFGII